MSVSRSHADASPVVTARSHSRGGDFITLMKPRLNFLVLLTTAAAYSLGAGSDSTLIDLAHTLLGTFLVAGGASALNQVWERQTDRLMRRTQMRPMADMRMTVAHGATFGFLLTMIGAAELAYFINPLSATVALLTTASYLLFYTPLKLRTSLSTIAGALPGALPAVIGWPPPPTRCLSRDGCCSASSSCGRCRTSWRSRGCIVMNTPAPACRCCR